jgi:TonB family protein
MPIKINMAARHDPLIVPFFSSCIVHIAVLVFFSTLMQRTNLPRQQLFPIRLVNAPPLPKETTVPKEKLAARKVSPQRMENRKDSRRARKSEAVQRERPAPPPAPKEQSSKPAEAKFDVTPKLESRPNLGPTAPVEGGGSETGVGNPSEKGDAAVFPGTGTSAGGGGTAASGLGRGSGAPGLPAQSLMKTEREAKPIQTARAAYPPMALRAGLESDVTLKIEVDPQGNVTQAGIIKSGGSGFDEEALKAVKQSRFEPAQRDGQNVPAEFTYIYRFRLHR